MLSRTIAPHLIKTCEQHPFVFITGPRHSGKSTLCRNLFSRLRYINLESPDQQSFVRSDQRGFLNSVRNGAIIDEVHRVPNINDLLESLADEMPQGAKFILVSSRRLNLDSRVTESLGELIEKIQLLPLSIPEIRETGASINLDELLHFGCFPHILERQLEPIEFHREIFAAYVERDISQFTVIQDRSTFAHFMRLCAGRIGQTIDFVKLGSDTGVSHTTARRWLEILEASYIVFRLPPIQVDIRKQLVKSPKLYFCDVGLASYLIGIQEVEQIATHPLRGALFENLVVSETLKHQLNHCQSPNLSFYRDSRGLECKLFCNTGSELTAVEIQPGATVHTEIFTSLNAVSKVIPSITRKLAVYGGNERNQLDDGTVFAFDEISDEFERSEVKARISQFVEDKFEPEDVKPETAILALVYRKFISPTIKDIELTLEQSNLSMLREYLRQTSRLSFDNAYMNFSSIEKAQVWDDVTREHILNKERALSSYRPATLVHEFTLSSTPTKHTVYRIVIRINWTFDDKQLTQSISIDGDPVRVLNERYIYKDLETQNPRISRISIEVLRTILAKMERRLEAGA